MVWFSLCQGVCHGRLECPGFGIEPPPIHQPRNPSSPRKFVPKQRQRFLEIQASNPASLVFLKNPRFHKTQAQQPS